MANLVRLYIWEQFMLMFSPVGPSLEAYAATYRVINGKLYKAGSRV